MDVIITYHPKDTTTLPYCLNRLHQHVHERRNVYCISSDSSSPYHFPETLFPFSKSDVAEYVGETRAGWYFQQLLKMYAANVIPNLSETFLIVDSDTIFINDVSFLTADGKPQYASGDQHHEPYFDHMSRLLPGLTKQTNRSGICHHMVMQKTYVNELMNAVEHVHMKPFWRCMLDQVSPDIPSGMSEYEIYFNYMLKTHPDKIVLRDLKWSNVQGVPNYKQKTIPQIIKYCKPHLHYVSIHSYLYD